MRYRKDDIPRYAKALVAFTDQTPELAKLRDEIYTARLTNANGKAMNFKTIKRGNFKPLYLAAIEAYKSQWGSHYVIWSKIYYLPVSAIALYCNHYANSFNCWKKGEYNKKIYKKINSAHHGQKTK